MSQPVRQPQEEASEPFPWNEVMGFLMGVLGWPPHLAWASTPQEVGMALAARHGHQARGMNGAVLEALMQDWPDQE